MIFREAVPIGKQPQSVKTNKDDAPSWPTTRSGSASPKAEITRKIIRPRAKARLGGSLGERLIGIAKGR